MIRGPEDEEPSTRLPGPLEEGQRARTNHYRFRVPAGGAPPCGGLCSGARPVTQWGIEGGSGLDDVTTYYLLHRHDFGMDDTPASDGAACLLELLDKCHNRNY